MRFRAGGFDSSAWISLIGKNFSFGSTSPRTLNFSCHKAAVGQRKFDYELLHNLNLALQTDFRVERDRIIGTACPDGSIAPIIQAKPNWILANANGT